MLSLIVEKSILNGAINISGAKNAALPILIASLLFDKVDLRNMPIKLLDVQSICNLLEFHGANIFLQKSCIDLDNTKLEYKDCPVNLTKQTRSSLWMLAPMLVRFGRVKLPTPGGCVLNVGQRLFNFHIDLLTKMGAEINFNDSFIEGNLRQNKKLSGIDFKFNNISVGATITGILAAVLASGTTNLENCAIEPEIIDLCNFLSKGGANIIWTGQRSLQIIGVEKLNNIEYSIISDRLEALTYALAVASTENSELILKNIPFNLIEYIVPTFNEAGISINIIENNAYPIIKNNYNNIVSINDIDVCGTEPEMTDFEALDITRDNDKLSNNNNLLTEVNDIKISKSDKKLIATNISTSPYPGFTTDLQAPFMAAMTIATGTSIIEENLFDNRLSHAIELKKMGAKIKIQSNNIAIVKGVKNLNGAEVVGLNLSATFCFVYCGP
ncbi:MAG: hypothetical protein U1E31_00280 [Rickettsiales bacterium]